MFVLDFLRHGALVGGVRYRGRIDDPLTPEGRAQMDRVWARIADEVDLIVCSPLSRCRLPAEDWAGEAGIECRIEPRLAELAYGDWEGLAPAQIERRWPELFRRWREDPAGLRPPGGEAPEELVARVEDWWHEAVRAWQGKRVLAVGHSGPLRVLIARVLGAGLRASRRLDVPYACWSRFAADAHAGWLVFHNRLP